MTWKKDQSKSPYKNAGNKFHYSLFHKGRILHDLNFTVWGPDPSTFIAQGDSGASFHLWH